MGTTVVRLGASARLRERPEPRHGLYRHLRDLIELVRYFCEQYVAWCKAQADLRLARW